MPERLPLLFGFNTSMLLFAAANVWAFAGVVGTIRRRGGHGIFEAGVSR